MNLIDANHLSKTVKQGKILDGITMSVKQGSITTLTGENGAGKTVLLKAILGLVHCTGELSVNNQIVTPQQPYPLRTGLLIENPSLIEEFSALRNLQLLAMLIPEVDQAEILNLLQIFKLNKAANLPVRKFSLGMKEKLGIAQALLGQPPLVILDEPTNALDDESKNELINIIRDYQSRGTTFLIASHDHEFVESVATQGYHLSGGKLDETA
ncbi:ATP-binding cassette domain-containing protein [Lapidilactobacillus wuchangensis]|uniref:ATP-binding cassette domain-containing protein n=1 Tax=Lapidilactobacillus wuchangensis TaxID=2486001 RepID=UPI000F78124A|nr:ABC transporter ATP-binding protein [Lapidilactobacillus wuchangensis]